MIFIQSSALLHCRGTPDAAQLLVLAAEGELAGKSQSIEDAKGLESLRARAQPLFPMNNNVSPVSGFNEYKSLHRLLQQLN